LEITGGEEMSIIQLISLNHCLQMSMLWQPDIH
jgi:hypothetical protein